MGLIRGLKDWIGGTKLRERSIRLVSGRKLNFILKERDERRFILMRLSSAGDYQYEQFEADEVQRVIDALTDLKQDLHSV